MPNSRIVLESTQASDGTNAQIVDILKVMSGKMLSVFGRGKKRIITTTAIIGVRGTAAYVEVDLSAPVTAVLMSNAGPIPGFGKD